MQVIIFCEYFYFLYFFFFQAEDGIRDFHVTGVQTCALPISAVALGPGDLQVAREGHQDRAAAVLRQVGDHQRVGTDRKSTRLNSSHVKISYAVFCLKKNNITNTQKYVDTEYIDIVMVRITVC